MPERAGFRDRNRNRNLNLPMSRQRLPPSKKVMLQIRECEAFIENNFLPKPGRFGSGCRGSPPLDSLEERLGEEAVWSRRTLFQWLWAGSRRRRIGRFVLGRGNRSVAMVPVLVSELWI